MARALVPLRCLLPRPLGMDRLWTWWTEDKAVEAHLQSLLTLIWPVGDGSHVTQGSSWVGGMGRANLRTPTSAPIFVSVLV